MISQLKKTFWALEKKKKFSIVGDGRIDRLNITFSKHPTITTQPVTQSASQSITWSQTLPTREPRKRLLLPVFSVFFVSFLCQFEFKWKVKRETSWNHKLLRPPPPSLSPASQLAKKWKKTSIPWLLTLPLPASKMFSGEKERLTKWTKTTAQLSSVQLRLKYLHILPSLAQNRLRSTLFDSTGKKKRK